MKNLITPICLLVLSTFVFAQQQPSPSDLDTRNNTKVIEPKLKHDVSKLAPLELTKVTVEVIGQGSDWGAAGDILVTFTGQGLTTTTQSPEVVLGGEYATRTTEVNKDGTELYLLLGKAVVEEKIKRLKFDAAIVRNNNGDLEKGGAVKIALTPDKITKLDPATPQVVLKYQKYFFTKERVRAEVKKK